MTLVTAVSYQYGEYGQDESYAVYTVPVEAYRPGMPEADAEAAATRPVEWADAPGFRPPENRDAPNPPREQDPARRGCSCGMGDLGASGHFPAPAAALANMDAISARIGPGGDPDLDTPGPGDLVVPAARLQAAWDDLLLRHREVHRRRAGHAALAYVAGLLDGYALAAGFPDGSFGRPDARPLDAALFAGRLTPLLPEHVRFFTDADGDTAFELAPEAR